jgi:phage terminase large subunit GpA-like protein
MTPVVTDDISFLENLVEQKPTEPGPRTATEFVHDHRIMPASTPLPGIVDVYRNPPMIEIMDNMSPDSPIQEQDLMKSVQSAATWAAENIIFTAAAKWNMEVLYVTGTDLLLKKWGKRMEPCIDSLGLRGQITAQVTDKKTRQTGDKQLSKRFKGGGGLDMGSAQSPASLRSDSKQMLVIDEVDSAPEQLKTGEGNYVDVAGGRTEAFLWKKKIMRFSTPTTWEGSIIYKEFLLGDQREYFVPCKHCGHMFFMKFKHLVPEYDKDGFLAYAWLKCPECSGKHVNSDKTIMLEEGEWRPMAKPSHKYRRSYHISKLMVPVGLATWTNVYQEYLKAEKKPDGMRSFYNLQLGLPYKETGSRPKINIDEATGGYYDRDVPDKTLFLTVCMDVQQGSKTDLSKPPRLEVEILGHGSNFRTWGIEYKVFKDPDWPNGPGISDPSRGAWESFVEWAETENSGLSYFRKGGQRIIPVMMFIDSKDGVTMETVYGFTQRPDVAGWSSWGLNVFPIKGEGFFKKNKDILGDEPTLHNMLKYKPAKNVRSGDIVYYRIATNHYKKNIYRNLKIKRETDPGKEQRMGFCDFPTNSAGYDAHYFKMLTSEEMHADGSFHETSYANEALDVRVMGLCAGDVYLDMLVALERDRLRKLGATALQVQVINRKVVLDILEGQLPTR